LGAVEKVGAIAGFSFKTLVVTMIGILLFGIYIGVLIFGENSLTVLQQLKEKKQNLIQESARLKNKNQYLQKKYFELKQLEPKDG